MGQRDGCTRPHERNLNKRRGFFMATASTNTVIGYFRNRSQAEKTIEELRNAQFRPEQLGMATSSEASGGSTGTYAGTGAGASTNRSAGTKASGGKSESLWDRIVHFFGGKNDDEQYSSEDFRGSLEYAGVTQDRARYFEYQLAEGDG